MPNISNTVLYDTGNDHMVIRWENKMRYAEMRNLSMNVKTVSIPGKRKKNTRRQISQRPGYSQRGIYELELRMYDQEGWVIQLMEHWYSEVSSIPWDIEYATCTFDDIVSSYSLKF